MRPSTSIERSRSDGSRPRFSLRRREWKEEPRPGLTVTRVERRYPVTGLTPSAWLESMALLGPRFEGKRVPARTEWKVRWSYVTRDTGGRFVAAAIRVLVHVTTVLPEWLRPKAVDPTLDARWASLRAALEAHEDEHRAFALRAGDTLLEQLKAPHAAPDAQSLKWTLDGLAQTQLAEVLASEREFDRRTEREAAS